jgi:uncharacterized protein YqcC (DUF446 family)
LLNNGMVVAIKKRPGAPSPEFVDEVIITCWKNWVSDFRMKTFINEREPFSFKFGFSP